VRIDLVSEHALGVVKRRHLGAADPSPPERVRIETDLARGTTMVLATCSDEAAELAALGVPDEQVAAVAAQTESHYRTASAGVPQGLAAVEGSRS